MESGNIYFQDNGVEGSELESQGEEEFSSNGQGDILPSKLSFTFSHI